MQTDEAENFQRVFKKISIRERWVIRIKKEREKKERKNVSGKLNDRERSRVKFRFLSGLRAIRSSGKLEISEFLPIPYSPCRYPFCQKNSYAKLECGWEHAWRRIPLKLSHSFSLSASYHFPFAALSFSKVGETAMEERWSGILIDLNFKRIFLSGLFQL